MFSTSQSEFIEIRLRLDLAAQLSGAWIELRQVAQVIAIQPENIMGLPSDTVNWAFDTGTVLKLSFLKSIFQSCKKSVQLLI